MGQFAPCSAMSNTRQDTPNPQTAAVDIAAQLNESAPQVQAQIQHIIDHLGVETAYAFLDQTKQCLAEGGVLTHDGKRKRTPGGTFFFLVRGGVTAEQHQAIWPQHQLPGHLRPRRSKPPRLTWDEARAAIPEALSQQGTAMSAKLTLVGRPGKIIEKEHVIITTLTSDRAPSIPRGVPKAPEAPVVYLVFIARQQWERVAEALAADENDRLVVTGYPVLDKETEAIVVLGQSVTTTSQQEQKRPSGKK
jgi:hypothetical protein